MMRSRPPETIVTEMHFRNAGVSPALLRAADNSLKSTRGGLNRNLM